MFWKFIIDRFLSIFFLPALLVLSFSIFLLLVGIGLIGILLVTLLFIFQLFKFWIKAIIYGYKDSLDDFTLKLNKLKESKSND